MRCIAVIEAERPGLDSVIIWERDQQLIAFAYQDGHVMMTRPLDAVTLDQAIDETRTNFQINTGQLSRITDWSDTRHPPERLAANPRTRW